MKVFFGEILEDSKKEKYRNGEMVVWIDDDNDLCLSVKVGKEIKLIYVAPELLNGLVMLAMRRQHETTEMERAASETEKAEFLAV